MNDSVNNVSTAQPLVELPILADGEASQSVADTVAEEVRKNRDIEIEKRFTYHPPKAGQPEKYQRLRDKAKDLAYLIMELCPNSRERNLALTELETSTFWANAAIARNE